MLRRALELRELSCLHKNEGRQSIKVTAGESGTRGAAALLGTHFGRVKDELLMKLAAY